MKIRNRILLARIGQALMDISMMSLAGTFLADYRPAYIWLFISGALGRILKAVFAPKLKEVQE